MPTPTRPLVRAAAALAALLFCRNGFSADEIHWTITGPTSVTFDWRGSPPENTIRYGLSAGSYGTTVTAASPTGTCVPYSSAGPFFEAKLTGLLPDTLYHYSIANGADHTFRSAPAAGASSFDILVAGDFGNGALYSRMVGVQQLMAQETDARFVLAVGDLTYADTHGLEHVGLHFNDVMPWSQDVAYMPAWGNHEWDNPAPQVDDLRNYKGRFELPNPQTAVGTPARASVSSSRSATGRHSPRGTTLEAPRCGRISMRWRHPIRSTSSASTVIATTTNDRFRRMGL